MRGHIDRELEPVFSAHGLGGASFGVLVTLARIEDEGGVSQRRLMDELGLTSGTIAGGACLGELERQPALLLPGGGEPGPP